MNGARRRACRARAAAWSVALLVVSGALTGCDGRNRARTDGTDRPADAGRLDGGPADRGRDTGRADGAADLDATPTPDAVPGSDARALDGAAGDARAIALDGAVDAMNDAAPDAGGPPDENDLFDRASDHFGQSDCPHFSAPRPAPGLSWGVAATVDVHPGPMADAEWLLTPLDLAGRTGPPEYLRGRRGQLQGLRWAGDAVYGLWSDLAGTRRVGPWLDGEWGDIGLGAFEPIAERPMAAFDIARGPDGETAVLYPGDGALVLVLDRGTDAAPQRLRWAVPGRLSAVVARIVADERGVVLGWTLGDTLELRAVGFDGGEQWAARLDVAGSGFDLALRPERIGLVHIGADPRLEDRPFAAGYGRPLLTRLHRVDGALLETYPLHPDAVRAADPAVGAREDGWMTAWVRLRVDGDRNRTEIEGSRVGPDGPIRPLRITRAHGYSFCPDVADTVAGRSAIAWVDTRDGRAEIFTAQSDFAAWPDRDVPEPSPAPPGFPEGCDAAVSAIEGPVVAFDARPSADGFRAVWTDADGLLSAGVIRADGGATVLWQVPDAPRATAVHSATSGPQDYLVTETDAGLSIWRTGPPPAPGGPPGLPEPVEVDLRGPLHALAGGAAGVIAIGADADGAPAIVRLDRPGDPIRLPPSDTAYRAGATADGFVVARHTPPGDPLAVEWLELPADPARWAARIDGPWQRLAVPGLAGAVRLVPARSGWPALLTGHYGRYFAGVILRVDPAADAPLRRLDIDPGSSTAPALHADGAIWIDERPVERFAVHFAPADGGPVQRLPVPAGPRTRLYLDVVDGDPVVLWKAGIDVRIARVGPECRLPAATAP